MPSIRIIPIAPVDRGLLIPLVVPVSKTFSLAAGVDDREPIDPSFSYDYSRNQYNSTSILAKLISRGPAGDDTIIAVTSVDLFVPVLTYVFGEAQLNGPYAVVSSYRLDDALYGLPPRKDLTIERLLKEAVHELGHCFGLLHCRDYACVMRSSTTVDDIDVKTASFCRDCASKISLTGE